MKHDTVNGWVAVRRRVAGVALAALTGLAALAALPAALRAQGADIPSGIAVTADGWVYMSGASMGADGRMEPALVVVDPTGTVRATPRLPSPGFSALGGGILLDGDAALIAGTAGSASAGPDIAVARFGRASLVGAAPVEAPASVALDCWPNPFSPSSGGLLQLRFTLPEAASAELTVFDVHGRAVAQIASRDYAPGAQFVALAAGRLPSGTYLARLTGDGLAACRAFVVTK